jgi:hypothetical protein
LEPAIIGGLDLFVFAVVEQLCEMPLQKSLFWVDFLV